MRVLITGAGGQLAWELARSTPKGFELSLCSRLDLDITDFTKVSQKISNFQPQLIINAAAYTAVDRAESETASAFEVNGKGVENLAKACPDNAFLLHVSTDFVFEGDNSSPNKAGDPTNPQSVYGKSKLAGERALFEYKPNDSAIIRTSWVYSSHGANFVKTMLRFMAEKPKLGIVADQIGTPTWAKGLADVCWAVASKRLNGIYHWSDAGAASWYDFAIAIQELGIEKGLLDIEIPIDAIPTEAYPLPAPRPAYSVMDKGSLIKNLPQIKNIHWRKQLHRMMDELKVEQANNE